MTTFILLALHDDGRSEAYAMPTLLSDAPPKKLEPVNTGYDRNPFSTYEAGGFSIDVQVVQSELGKRFVKHSTYVVPEEKEKP